MSRKQNDKSGGTSGFAEVDYVAPGTVKADPGAKPSTGGQTFTDWVKADMEYKASLPKQKFY